jgi:hypothetical protein
MEKDKEAAARRVIVNIMTREHRKMVGERVGAEMKLAAKRASFAVYKAHVEKECEGQLGFGPNFQSDEREIEYLVKQAELATHNEQATAQAMEYVTFFFLDQMDKAKV